LVYKTKRHNPLAISLDSSIEDFFTKAPEKTQWFTDLLDHSLKGAAYNAVDYLDKIDPLSESQLKAIFPNATPTQMQDPLTTVTKGRLHDNVRRDPSTQRGLLVLIQFLLGKEINTVIDVNRKFANEQRKKAELDAISNNEQYLDILEDISNRDEEVGLYQRLSELVFSAEAFGRSVQVKKYDKKGYPCELIPLASTRLGRVWVDRKNWHFLGVEYLDYPRNNRILLAKDIIHHEVNDFHITPNSRYFGMPSIESSMSIGERNRSANEIAVPEIMKRMFAPIMLVKTMTKSEAKLTEIRDKWKAGKTLFINDDITAEAVPLQHDLQKMIEAVREGSKDIYRGLTIPLVVAFQDEQNRATGEGAMIQWYESALEFKRRQLNNVLWQQWYKPQLEQIFKDNEINKIAQQGGVMNYLLERATNPQEITLPFKVKLEFSNIKTTGFLDTAAAVAQFHDRQLLTGDMARNEAGLGKYNNEMAEYEQMKIQNNSMMDSLYPNPDQQGGFNVGSTPSLTGQSSFDNKMQSRSSLPTRSPSAADEDEY